MIRSLRLLQLAAVVAAVLGSVAFSAAASLGAFADSSASYGGQAVASLVASVLFAVCCVQAQRVAHALGGPTPSGHFVLTSLYCVFLSFIGIPMTLARTGKAVGAAVDDDKLAGRTFALAWVIGLSPMLLVAVRASVFSAVDATGLPTALWVLTPLFGVLLNAIGLHLVVSPLVAALEARAPLGGVDGDATSAAVRSL